MPSTGETTHPAVSQVGLAEQHERIGHEIRAAIDEVLRHGRFINGPEVAQLEERLASYSGARSVVACASGTDALLMSLMALGIGRGDAVYVPSFTFVATAEVVALLGATPVFVDVREDTFNIDPESLSAAIGVVDAAGLRHGAAIPVDMFGQPAELMEIRDIADRHGIQLLVDAAQSFGGRRHERPVGGEGVVTTTSFFPAKPLGCYGDGGAIFAEDQEIATRLRSIREHGKGAHKYDIVRIGVNGRLDTLQAAILLCKLEILDDEIRRRNEIAGRYSAELAEVVSVPTVANGMTSAWAQYTIKVAERDSLNRALTEAGVPTAVYYPTPLHLQPAYGTIGLRAPDLTGSERLAGQVLSLPLHPYLTEEAQQHVIGAVKGRSPMTPPSTHAGTGS